jgi:hypothetical protein
MVHTRQERRTAAHVQTMQEAKRLVGPVIQLLGLSDRLPAQPQASKRVLPPGLRAIPMKAPRRWYVLAVHLLELECFASCMLLPW